MSASDEHEMLVYELAEWNADDRARLSLLLEAQGIPHQWEGDELLVPEGEEERVDAVLDEVEFPDALDAAGDEGDDEERYEVLSDLFLAMDRLADANPVTVELAAEAIAAVEAVLALPRPFGVEEHDWDNIRRRAAAVSQELQVESDDDVIVGDAAALRDLLRQFV